MVLSTASRFSRNKADAEANKRAEIAFNLHDLGLMGDGRSRRQNSLELQMVDEDRGSIGRPQTLRHPKITQPSLLNPATVHERDYTALPSVAAPVLRTSKSMTGMSDPDIPRMRRDRTFVGSECVVCEERLEYTLGGERALQLICAHIVHESCYHEYISEIQETTCPKCNAPLALDANRGSNVTSSGTINSFGRESRRSVSRDGSRSLHAPTMPWDEYQNGRLSSPSFGRHTLSPLRNTSRTIDVVDSVHFDPHKRNGSEATGSAAHDMSDGQMSVVRRSDLDNRPVQSSSKLPKAVPRNSFPSPVVTIKKVAERKVQAMPVNGRVPLAAPTPRKQPRVKTNKPKGVDRNSLRAAHQQLQARVDNWHGLDGSRFGELYLHAHVRVGKDQRTWQDLECYLFSEMLICVKEKRAPPDSIPLDPRVRCTLKGSILIKKHLEQVEVSSDRQILTLKLSVAELPQFHLQFKDQDSLEMWRKALFAISNNQVPNLIAEVADEESSEGEDDGRPQTSGAQSVNLVPNGESLDGTNVGPELHVPLDVVVVIPVSSSMQGLKIALLRDALRFLVASLGSRDRMGLVSFGSNGGGTPIVGLTNRDWAAWPQVFDSIKPVGAKNLRADTVEGANVAMDLLMQRKSPNPVSSILLISDSSTSDLEGINFVVSRAEAAKVAIHSFGLGLTHKPDAIIELSNRTKASYTYIKDWNALRECLAGCLGSLQSTSHQNARLKLRLPEGSPAKFLKIAGALLSTVRATGKDADATLGDLRFGDKRDVLVQLSIEPDTTADQSPHDAWESIVSGLEALGGDDADESVGRPPSVEEVPLLQADLIFGDVLREGQNSHLPRPTLLTITVLPPPSNRKSTHRLPAPVIPPHPSVVQRRIEILASDMLTRALGLVSKGQHERAHQLLTETRTIIKGLGKGGLPPLPPPSSPVPQVPRTPTSPRDHVRSPTPAETPRSHPLPRSASAASPRQSVVSSPKSPAPTTTSATTSYVHASIPSGGPSIDPATMSALDAELASSLEWIQHPAVFLRDARKAVLQAIGVMSTQRAYTSRTPLELLWAERVPGIRRVAEMEREWRAEGMVGVEEEDGVAEE